MILKVTSEASMVYQAPQQLAMVQALASEALSVGLREIDQPEILEQGLADLFHWLVDHRVMTRVILYDEADLRRWQQRRQQGVVTASCGQSEASAQRILPMDPAKPSHGDGRESPVVW